MLAMALDKFFTILLVSWIQGQFLKILKKGGAPTYFSAPLLNFLVCSSKVKTVIIYMLFNNLGR